MLDGPNALVRSTLRGGLDRNRRLRGARFGELGRDQPSKSKEKA